MKIFAKIKFYFDAFIILIVVALATIPLISIFKKHKGAIIHYSNRVMLFLIGGKVQKVGDIDINADMYIFNHQGLVDIIAFEALQKRHARWVAKVELFNIPYIGNLLKKGEMISVDRGDKKSLIGLIKDIELSRSTLKRPVAIFPEGTRAKKQKLIPFKSGTKLIAEQLSLTIQPVVITGSKNLLNEGDKTAHSGTIRYIFLDSVKVGNAEDNWYKDIEIKMQEVIDDELKYSNRSR